MWTTSTSPFDGGFGEVDGVCWASDLDEFLAVGVGGVSEVILRSADGITWTARSSPLDGGQGLGVVRAEALGLYVVVGYDPTYTDAIVTSPDHVTWTGRGNPFSAPDGNYGTCVDVKPSTGVLVAGGNCIGTSDNPIATSANGTAWTSRSSPFDSGIRQVNGIGYSATHDRWIAVGQTTAYVGAYSDDDGATWTALPTPPFPSADALQGVYYDATADQWIVTGLDLSGATVSVSTDNGATWTMVTAPVDSTGFAAIRIGMVLGLAGQGTAELAISSSDGTSWAADTTPNVFDTRATSFAYSPVLNRAVVGGIGTSGSLAYGLPTVYPAGGRVWIAFDDGPLEPSPVWTCLDTSPFPDQFVAGYDTHEGRQTLLSQTDTGTAAVYINDHEQGLFDPRNVSSAYFDKLDGRQILLQLYNPVTGIWEPQFRGWIDFTTYDINGSAVNADGDPINASIQLECVDVFDILAEYGLTPGLDGITPRVVRAPAGTAGGPVPAGFEDGVYYAETVGTNDDRIIEILTDVGIDSTRWIVASGNTHVLAVKYDPDESALVAIRDACDADLPFIANCYCNRSGQFVFRGRYSRFYPDDVAGERGSEWDFTRWAVGDGKAIETDSTRAQMRVLSYTRGRQDVINVAISYPQGIDAADMPAQVFADTSSITSYGKHNAPPMSDLLVAADQSDTPTPSFNGKQLCAAYAEILVKNKKSPHVAVSALQVKTVHPDDARAATTWAFLTRSDISHVVNVAVGYPGGTGFNGDSPADDHFIEGRSLVVRPLQPGFDYVELNVETTPVEWSSDFHGVFPNPFPAPDAPLSADFDFAVTP